MSDRPAYANLRGVSVFIIGGGSGIGASLTEGFLHQGARDAFVQRADSSAFCNAMEPETGSREFFIPCDIPDIPALGGAVEQASQAHSRITVQINIAANDRRHEKLAVTEEFWDYSHAINLKAYFFAIQAVVSGMLDAGCGGIANFTSFSHMMGTSGYPAYTVKSGINGMTRSLAREFGPDRIRVNATGPGWVLTPEQTELWVTGEALKTHLARQFLKDALGPEDTGGGNLFLASNASKMMPGQSPFTDGGVVTTG